MEGSDNVFVNGAGLGFDGAAVAGHGINKHSSPNMIASTGSVFVNGIAVVREGDLATCGHDISGSGDVFIGG